MESVGIVGELWGLTVDAQKAQCVHPETEDACIKCARPRFLCTCKPSLFNFNIPNIYIYIYIYIYMFFYQFEKDNNTCVK